MMVDYGRIVTADWTRDEIILACALISANGWKGMRAHQREVQELSAVLRTAPIHPMEVRDERFRSPNSVQRKTFDIATQHPNYSGKPTRGNRLDRIVLGEFLADPVHMRDIAAAIRDAIVSREVKSVLNDEIDAADMTAKEGRVLLSRHLLRERSTRLRSAKLRQIARMGATPNCDVCGFDFKKVYGRLGEGYIEVHHQLPLHASGPRETRLSDLVLLCANCHRMIHRSAAWLTPDELRRHMLLRGELG